MFEVHCRAARKLMSAVQSIRPAEIRIPKTKCVIDEVSVARHGRQPRKRVGDNKVHTFHAGYRVSLLRREFHLQSVVSGSPNGEEHLVRANARVDSRKSGTLIRGTAGSRSSETTQETVARIQTFPSVIKDCRLCVDCAVNGSGGRTGSAPNTIIGCGNRI